MGGNKPYSLDAIYVVDTTQKLRERDIVPVLVIGIYILTEKRHLFNACGCEFSNLLKDPCALPAAHIGYDAVAAKVVAAFYDRHICPDRAFYIVWFYKKRGVAAVLREIEVRCSFCSLLNGLGDFVNIGSTKREVDEGKPFKKMLLFELGDAPRYPQNGAIFLFHASEPAHAAVKFLFCLRADTAGIDDDHIGLLGITHA